MTGTMRSRSFDRAAEEYERGRPGHPKALLDLVPVDRGATVLDLGAGTGKLTRVLAVRYARTIAVEPLDGMRAILAASMSWIADRPQPEREAILTELAGLLPPGEYTLPMWAEVTWAVRT